MHFKVVYILNIKKMYRTDPYLQALYYRCLKTINDFPWAIQ